MTAAAEAEKLTTRRAVAARPLVGFLVSLLRSPSGCIGLFIVAVLVVAAAAAPLIAPYDPLRMGAGPRLQPPSLDYLMGTDDFGRDVFSRIVYGAQLTLKIGVIAVGIYLTIGVLLGLVAGSGSRWV